MGSFYTPEHRALQDRFVTRRLADTQERAIVSERLSEADRTFIAERDMLFLSTIDATGQPTVSYKGGAPGFVRVDDDDLLLPCYDGNGMFLSMGNVMGEARVGLLFIDFETPRRLRVHGVARLDETMPAPGAAIVMRIRPTQVFLNCPRYVHRYRREDSSRYVPDAQGNAPVAEWKRLEFLQEDLPPADHKSVAAIGTVTQSEYDAKVSKGNG
jgi:predicted pyridoxine 5'-phosphate oxidase superfamily flavin-nucleotide-binding protein